MALPPDKNVATLFIGALLYGLYLATLLHCLRWLLFADEGWKLRKRREIQWPMLLVTLLLFSLSLTNLALSLRSTMRDVMEIQTEALTNTVAGVPGPTWVTLVLCTNANLSALIADATLMYRCWLVCGKSNRIMIFPLILWVGGIGCTGLEAYWQVVQSQKILHAWQPVNTKVGPGTVLTPFWGSTVVLNAYSTGLIVYRIWSVAKNSSKSGISTHQIRFVMRVLVESGALYLTIATIHFLVWFTPNNFAISVLSSINLPVIGIAFNLILMRTNQRRVDEESKVGSEIEEKAQVSELVFHHTIRSGGANATRQTVDLHTGDSENTTVIDVRRMTAYSTSGSEEYLSTHV